MKNSNHITTIEKRGTTFQVEGNRTATAKQLYALSQKWGKESAKAESERFGLAKVFYAILKKYQLEHSSTPITQRDVETWFDSKSLQSLKRLRRSQRLRRSLRLQRSLRRLNLLPQHKVLKTSRLESRL
jgi:hypothetical protein